MRILCLPRRVGFDILGPESQSHAIARDYLIYISTVIRWMLGVLGRKRVKTDGIKRTDRASERRGEHDGRGDPEVQLLTGYKAHIGMM